MPSKIGQWLARERFLYDCEVRSGSSGGCVLLRVAASLDLFFARFGDEFTSCRKLGLALNEDALCFGGSFCHPWRYVFNVSHLTIGSLYARLLSAPEFWIIPKIPQHLWRRLDSFNRCVRKQLGYLDHKECIEIHALTIFAWFSCYVFLSPKWLYI